MIQPFRLYMSHIRQYFFLVLSHYKEAYLLFAEVILCFHFSKATPVRNCRSRFPLCRICFFGCSFLSFPLSPKPGLYQYWERVLQIRPTPPGKNVSVPNFAFYTGCYITQNAVSNQVPVIIIDFFKTVNV